MNFLKVNLKNNSSLLFAGQKIRHMSWNLNNADENKDLGPVAEVIKQNGYPDSISLQEVKGEKTLEKLNKKLANQYPYRYIAPFKDKRGFTVAFMVKNSMDIPKFENFGYKRVPGTQQSAFTRDFIKASVKPKDNPFKISLFNGHFKSMTLKDNNGNLIPAEAETNPVRLKEAQAAHEVMNCERKKNLNIMLTADLNAIHNEYGEPVLNIVSGKADNDPKNYMTEVLEENGTIPFTHKGSHGERKLDYGFVSQELRPYLKKAEVVGDFKTYPYNNASDHIPQIYEFEAPDPPQSSVIS